MTHGRPDWQKGRRTVRDLGHPVFDADYERFWRRYRSEEAEVQELTTIERLGKLKPGWKVLDLACGFGRISNRLALRGFAVTGVDTSPGLLAIAREESDPGTEVRFVLGDMRSPYATEEYDLVLLWSTSLGYYEEDDDEATLRTAWQALSPGGFLLVETRHWDAFDRSFDDHTLRQHGADVLEEWHRYDPVTGRQVTRQRLRVGGKARERSYHVRRYGAPELRGMAHRAGFVEIDAFDQAGLPLTTMSRRLVLRARRRAH